MNLSLAKMTFKILVFFLILQSTEQNRTLLPQAKVLMASCQNSQHGRLCWLPIIKFPIMNGWVYTRHYRRSYDNESRYFCWW